MSSTTVGPRTQDRIRTTAEDEVRLEPSLPEPRTDARPPDPRKRRSALWIAGIALCSVTVLVGLFVAYEFALTGVFHASDQRTLTERFRHVLTTETRPDKTLPVLGRPVAELAIPSLGIKEIVVEGTSPDLTKKAPGHLRGTPLPGQYGNAIVIGRRTSYGAPFRNVTSLPAGSTIIVTTAQGVFRYLVTGHSSLDSGSDLEARPSDVGTLTLVTSSPPFLARDEALVEARMKSKGFPPVQPAPPVFSADELGLAGHPGGIAGLALWVEVLAAAVAIGFISWKRFSGWTAYLLATPVLVALTIVMFENFDRLLPGTL